MEQKEINIIYNAGKFLEQMAEAVKDYDIEGTGNGKNLKANAGQAAVFLGAKLIAIADKYEGSSH